MFSEEKKKNKVRLLCYICKHFDIDCDEETCLREDTIHDRYLAKNRGKRSRVTRKELLAHTNKRSSTEEVTFKEN